MSYSDDYRDNVLSRVIVGGLHHVGEICDLRGLEIGEIWHPAKEAFEAHFDAGVVVHHQAGRETGEGGDKGIRSLLKNGGRHDDEECGALGEGGRRGEGERGGS